MIKENEIPEELKKRIVGELINGHSNFINQQLFGATTCASQPDEKGITYDDLVKTVEYFQPETLEVGGKEHEIYGYKVHTAFVPDGFKVLTRKRLPDERFDLDQKEGDLIIIDEKKGKAFVSKEQKFSLFGSERGEVD